jgi:hypothetical protein
MKIKHLTAPIAITSLLLLTACPAPIHMTTEPERTQSANANIETSQAALKAELTSELQVTAVALNAESTKDTVPCPAEVKFSGSITAKGKGQVEYTFVRSDGATAPVYTLNFSQSGTQNVSTTWTLGDGVSLPSYTGWQTLKVLSPNAMESLRESGAFSIKCQQ